MPGITAGSYVAATNSARVKQIRRVCGLLPSLGVILSGVLLLILSACSPNSARGATTKEALVETYLRALEQKDRGSILSLVPENLVAEQAVQAKIEQFGGHTFRQTQVDYSPPIHPLWVRVVIRGTYISPQNDQIEFNDELILHQMDGRWYLMVGQDRIAVSPPPTSQP